MHIWLRLAAGGRCNKSSNCNVVLMNMSSAINVFFRQAVREQAIPFELKPYDGYYSGQRLQRILNSKAQAERGEIITKTLAELEAMENE